MTAQENSLLKAALALAAKGKQVFPVQARGKIPLTARGFKDASIDPTVITAWWQEHPNANIGMATGNTSGVFVLDIDGDEGEQSCRALENKHGPLPSTTESITGGGGRHLFFLWPQRGNISNSAGKLGTGLDIRGNGGYVVVPPSIHASGKPYAWSVDSGEQAFPAPAWLLNLISNPPDNKKITPVSEWRDLAKGVSEGQRNDALARIAGKLLGNRIDPYMTLELCHAWNETRCKPSLTSDEVIRTVDSIAARELSRRGA